MPLLVFGGELCTLDKPGETHGVGGQAAGEPSTWPPTRIAATTAAACSNVVTGEESKESLRTIHPQTRRLKESWPCRIAG